MVWVGIVGLLVLGVPVIIGSFLFLFQRTLLYPGRRLPLSTLPHPLPSNIEKIDYAQGYGLFLNAATHDGEVCPVMIYVHGNAETAWLWSGAFAPIVDAGISVLLLEYPGYAKANGSPSYESIKAATLECYDHIVTRTDVDERAVIAYGRSMGGGAASLLADNRPLAALCLECTFASLPQLVREKKVPSFLLTERYENADILARLDIPTFLYHGTEDTLIPVHHSQQLATVARNATFITGAFGHNNCPRPWDDLLTFIQVKTAIAPRIER